MRPFEVLLSIANAVALFGLILPQFRSSRIGYVVAVVALVALLQVVVEGPRWQMVPGYVLSVALALSWLVGVIWPDDRGMVVTVVSAAAGFLLLVVASALPAVIPVFAFPTPTGPHAIGTVIYHWVDSSRPEPFTADPNDHRELMAQVWYPAKTDPSAPRAPYLEDSDRETAAFATQFGLPGFVFSHLKYVKTHAVSTAPVDDDQPRYPVLVFVTGIEGYRQSNMLQIEELVSRGYVVVGFDQPGTAALVNFPDGRQILGMPKAQVQPLIDQSGVPEEPAPNLNGQPIPNGLIPLLAPDVSFVLDQLTKIDVDDPNRILTGRLDLEHVGAFGVSLGAMVVPEACLNEPRLMACLMYDGFVPLDVVNAGLDRPSMWLTRDADTMRREGWTERNVQLTYSTMRKTYEEVRSDAYFVQVASMYHVNFTDLSYWSPVWQWLGVAGPIDLGKGYGIVNSYSVAFFDRHLKGVPVPLLDNPSPQPGVTVEKRTGL